MVGLKRIRRGALSGAALSAAALALVALLSACPEVDLKTRARTLAAPAAPGSVAASAAGETSASVNWEDLADNETGFEIQRSHYADSGWEDAGAAAAGAETWLDESLTAATSYYYRVRAANEAGESAWAGPAGVTTLADSVTLTIQIYPDGGGIVETTYGSVDEAEGSVEVERGEAFELVATAMSGYSFEYWTLVTGTGVTFGSDESTANNSLSLADGDATIRAEFDKYPTLSVSTLSAGTIVTIADLPSGFTLSWTGAEDNEDNQAILQYRVVRSTGNNIETASAIENAVAGNNATVVLDWSAGFGATCSCDLSGLSSGTRYYFNVLVRDSAGNSMAYTMREGPASLRVVQGATAYADGSTYNFGAVYSTIETTFVIQNNGFADLTLSSASLDGGSPCISWTAPTLDAIAPGSTREFIVTFVDNYSTQQFTGTVSIVNGSADQPDYFLTVTGVAAC